MLFEQQRLLCRHLGLRQSRRRLFQFHRWWKVSPQEHFSCGRREGVRWVDAYNLLPRRRFDEFVIDEQANRLPVFPAIGSLEVNKEVGHRGAL